MMISCRNLTNLTISSEHIEVLPLLPPTLQQLCLTACNSLRVLPALPPTLQQLQFVGCKALKALPNSLSSTAVSNLTCSNCDGLRRLPQLPQTLVDLHLIQCSNLCRLPALPQGLMRLELYVNDALKEVSCRFRTSQTCSVCLGHAPLRTKLYHFRVLVQAAF
jgi:hypothetical protein